MRTTMTSTRTTSRLKDFQKRQDCRIPLCPPKKGTPGYTVGPQLRKLGIRSHDTCNLLFDNCRIPEFNHIKGDFKSTMSVFNDSRPMVGAMALGVARAALDFTREKLAERGIEID